MGKTLILTEKPSVARDFASALGVKISGKHFFEGEGTIITWALGHLLELDSPEQYGPQWKKWSLTELPIIPEKFNRHPVKNTWPQLQAILKILKRKDIGPLIVATDAGREGELIARSILQMANVHIPMWRFWCSEALSKSVIVQELKKIRPLKEYDDLYYSALSRQLADWLVGMNLTRAATVCFGGLFSIGRVQTTVLALIVDRFKERQNFKPTPYFKLHAQFHCVNENESKQYSGEWYDPKIKENPQRIMGAEKAQRLAQKLKQALGVIKKVKVEEKIWPSPLLYSLTELQREANSKFGFSAQQTLQVAQSLYEKHKCLSYPRTDSSVLGESSSSLAQSLVKNFLQSYPEIAADIAWYKTKSSYKRLFNQSKLTDHHALIPLKEIPVYANPQEKKIFDLVLRRFLAAFSADCRYQKTEIDSLVMDEMFRTQGRIYLDKGHRKIYPEQNLHDQVLPPLKEGEQIKIEKLTGESCETTPPALYTEASLLAAMSHPASLVEEKEWKDIFRKEVGLGTQATRAQIIETLIDRKYMQREDKKLVPLPKGIFLVEKLEKMPMLKLILQAKHTAQWESELENICQGKNHQDFLQEIKTWVTKGVDDFKSAHQEQKQWAQEFGPINQSEKINLRTLGICPQCQSEVFEHKSFYSCQNFVQKSCQFVVWKSMAKKWISPEIVSDLLSQKKSKVLSGFVSNQGKKFSALLKLNPNQDEKFKVIFEFLPKKKGPKKIYKKTTKRVVSSKRSSRIKKPVNTKATSLEI